MLTAPSDWYYRTNLVTYSINTEGYRTREFDEIAWQHSIVLFGDEMAFGQGLTDTDTIAHHLSTLTSQPVVNLAQPGSSAEWNLHTALDVLETYGQPSAAVFIWPNAGRWISYEHALPQHQGPWTPQQWPLRDQIERSRRAAGLARSLFNRHRHFTLQTDHAELYNAQQLDAKLLQMQPSRCGTSPGRSVTIQIANEIRLSL